MKLQENVGSDRSWVYTTQADFSDEAPTAEVLAIRFATPEAAKEFKTKFEECQEEMKKLLGDSATTENKESS